MNTYEVVRTNYFRVSDEGAFRAFMEHVVCDFGLVDIWTKKNTAGEQMFAFGSYSQILGVVEGDPDYVGDLDDDAYENFLLGLQECVKEGDAIIMMTIGHQKLKEVFAEAVVITSNDTDFIDLKDAATDLATDMLRDQYESAFE